MSPARLLDLRGAWPFPALRQTDTPEPVWARIDDKDARTLLECLPPIWLGRGAWAMSEPSRHDDQGRAVRCVIMPIMGRGHWATECTREAFGARAEALTAALWQERKAGR